MGRDLCLFLTVDASKVPKKQREGFVALAVKRAAPFDDPEYDIAWSTDGAAAVWYWSRARARSLLGEQSRKRQKFLAEAAFTGEPKPEGTELLALPEGMEGRVWSNGRLHASRWWPQPPTALQWQDFIRGVGQATAVRELPDPVKASAARLSWSGKVGRSDAMQLDGLDQYLPKAGLLVSALFLLIVGWQSGSIVRAHVDILRAESDAQSLDAPLQRILEARANADAANAQISELLALRGPAPVTSVMAEFARLMPAGNWQVKRWTHPTLDRLEVTLLAPDANPEQLVTLFEASPIFSGVTSDLSSGSEITLKASLSPASNDDGGDQ